MLLPTVSVTVIGLTAGLIFLVIRRIQPLPTLLLDIVGAWVSFILGAVFGVAMDVIVQTGIFVVIVGHIMAILGSALALFRFCANGQRCRTEYHRAWSSGRQVNPTMFLNKPTAIFGFTLKQLLFEFARI